MREWHKYARTTTAQRKINASPKRRHVSLGGDASLAGGAPHVGGGGAEQAVVVRGQTRLHRVVALFFFSFPTQTSAIPLSSTLLGYKWSTCASTM